MRGPAAGGVGADEKYDLVCSGYCGAQGTEQLKCSTVTWVRVGGERKKHNNREMVRREQSSHSLNVEPTGVVDGWGDFESVFPFSAPHFIPLLSVLCLRFLSLPSNGVKAESARFFVHPLQVLKFAVLLLLSHLLFLPIFVSFQNCVIISCPVFFSLQV